MRTLRLTLLAVGVVVSSAWADDPSAGKEAPGWHRGRVAQLLEESPK